MKIIYAFLLVVFGVHQSYSQCTATFLFPITSVTPSIVWSDISTCNNAGDYANVNVVAGNIYEFSTCSSNGSTVTYDSELTLRNNSGALIAYNNDYCGTQSYISWTATYTGVAQIHLHVFSCGSNTTCSNIRMKMTAPPPPPPPGLGCVATSLYPSNTLTPTAAWSDISTCNFAGEYANVNVVAGNIYEFSTCSSNGSTVTYDSELTLRNNSGALIAYNNDYCGTQSYISWTATYTGVAQIHLHVYSCLSNTTCSNIRMKVTSSAPAPTNNDCANATLLAVNTSCLLTSGTTSGATEDPILDPSCDAGSINDVWYTFNSGANTSVNVTVNLVTASFVGIEIFSACGTLATGISLGGVLGNCDFNASAPNPTVLTGLTPNTVYRFRLFTNVTYDIAGSFTVCLTVPPPPPPPTVSINSASICPGASTTLIATPSTLGGTYLWSPGGQTTQSITVSPLITTTYSVTYTLNGIGTNNSTVTVYSPPAINAGLDISICSGQPATLTGSGGVSYTWDNGVTNNLAFNPLITTTYTVTGTDLNGCIGTDQMTLTVNANPTLSGNTVICSNTTSQLTGSGIAAANNAWVSSNAAVATVSTTGLVSALSFGTATITYTNNNGCSATSTINVSNPTAPTFNPVAAVCTGGAIVLPIISSNGIQGTWSPAINNTQTTTYTFAPSAGQCATTAQLSVAVNPNPTISGIISVCSGGTLQLTGSGTAAANNAWASASTAIASISGTGLVTGTSAGTSVVTYTNSNGCSATASVTVNANPTLSGNNVICPNTTSQLTGSGIAAANNAWVSSNAAVATVSTTGLVSALSFGTATITYTNNNGCSATSTINVSNPTAPTFNPVAAVCPGGAIVLPIISSNGIQGTWSPAINNTQTTTYTFTPSAGQCATTAQLSVAVNPNPIISGGTSLCPGGTLQLTGSGTAAANNAWTSASAAIASISGTGLVTGTSAGTSVVTYTNSDGCSATATVTVNANPTANAGLDITICVGGNVTLSGAASNGAAPYSYSWNNNAQNGVPFVALTNNTYTLTVSDGNGCTNTDQMTLTANSIDWANLQWPSSGNICLGQSHTIYGQIYVAGVTNGPGQAAGIIAQAGLNASNTDPSTWPISAWSAATFNTQQGNNDEYMASVGQLLPSGTYYYTYRYSLGAGCPYFYAGFNGGAWNGTSNTNGSLIINNAPNSTINQSACSSYSWYGQTYTQSGTYTETVPSVAGCDSVLYLNLTIHQPVTGPSTQQTACETYTWNGQTYTQSGSYTFNGTTQFGCDSTATLNLVIEDLPSNLNVTLNGGTFTATGSNVTTYNWIDCATNTSIPNQTAATFTPTISGSYAVVISNNCGSDTSGCEPFEVNGLSDAVLPIINIYPNPSSGIFHVFSEMEITFIEILDLKGAVIYNSKPNGNLVTLDLRFQADGIYILKLRTPKNVSYFRIVKN